MNSRERFDLWCGHLSLPLPAPDAQGLSRLAVGDSLLLHVLTNPDPQSEDEDDVFVYLALANANGIDPQARDGLLRLLGAWNLPGGLPAGVRLGMEEKTGLLWLAMRLRAGSMDAMEFDAHLRRFVAVALGRRDELDRVLAGDTPQQTSAPSAFASAPVPDGAKLSDEDLIARMRSQNPMWG